MVVLVQSKNKQLLVAGHVIMGTLVGEREWKNYIPDKISSSFKQGFSVVIISKNIG
jgi:hypothetical protein